MPIVPDFTEADLRRAAGSRSFERGRGYLDMVEDLYVTATRITATVRGTHDYAVSLIPGDQGLSGRCSCPHSQEGFFCKHCVAVGLSVLRAGADLPPLIEAARVSKSALDGWLESLSKEDLLSVLRDLLHEDRGLRWRFELRVASVKADGAMVRRAVEGLMVPRRDEISYSEAAGYADGVREAAAAIGKLVEAGEAAGAIQIAREAIGLLIQAYERVDDSSGAVGAAARELLSAHLRACRAAPPEPASLGDYLADLLLGDDYGFDPSLDDYADLLGETGFGRLRERIAGGYAEDPNDWRAKRLMESMVKAEGDVDAIVAFYAADLDDRGWNHLRISQELDEAGRSDEALRWAERGLREATHPDARLVEYLANRYASAGRIDDVLALRRTCFEAERTLANYQLLRQAATSTGKWPAERHKALQLLGADVRGSRARGLWAWGGPVLVDALLDDGDLDAAWAAAKGAATQLQWLRLADAAAATRPAEALAVYHRAIEQLKTLTGNDVYQRIASLLLSARACHQSLGTAAEFERYVAAFRMDQKRKRNLMKILDENGL
ncbi:MAG: SWIM zinc finger family protein [Micromonosporaceae bacterium]